MGVVGGAPEANNLVYTKRQKHMHANSTHETTKKTLKDLEHTIAHMDPKSIPPFFIVQVLGSNLFKNFFALFPLFSCYFDSRKAKSV